MNKRLIKWLGLGILTIIILILAIMFVNLRSTTQTKTITIGSQATDTEVWKHIANSKVAKNHNVRIIVKDFTDSNSLNTALANNDIQANAFQSYAFFTTYNKSNPKRKIFALGTTYIQPMGLYSTKYKSVQSISKNQTIAIGNDAASQSRGLKLLESAGLITLKKHDINDLLTPNDVIRNSKNLQIKSVLSTTTPSLLHDKGIAAVAIDNNTAQAAKLNVFKNSIYYEKLDQNTRANVNVIATNAKHRNDSTYKKLVTIYHDPTIQSWIKKNYPGKMEIRKSISDLEK